MPTTLQRTPEPDDGPPPPGVPEPYWRAQLWLPGHRRDTRGMLADLCRRLLTRMFNVRWRLSIEVGLDADIDAPDETAATAAVEASLRAPGTLIALSRTNRDAVPPWRSLGVTDRPPVYLDYGADATDRNSGAGDDDGDAAGDVGTWSCMATLVVAFTVDVAEASWPHEHYTIDVFPAAGPPGLAGPRTITTRAVWVARRLPVRRPPAPRAR
jgi:hypothetical protein